MVGKAGVSLSVPHYSPGIDFFMHEFFVLQPFRGTGIAERAATTIFGMYRGSWELFTNPAEKNQAGQRFWRRTLSNYTRGVYEEKALIATGEDGPKLIFRFSNDKIDDQGS